MRIRTLAPSEHLEFIAGRDSVSFLQTPGWGRVKSEWRSEPVGWFDGERLLGAGLVLYRQLPRLRRYLAYVPQGPDIDWDSDDIAAWLDPLAAHVRRRGAFGLRIGPPVVARRWSADVIKAAIADPAVSRLGDARPVEVSTPAIRLRNQLRSLGWRPPRDGHGFASGQPQYNFWLPVKGRSDDELLAGMNQLWRRNIKKAAKAGVRVRVGGRQDLAAFHPLYVETARRDGFTPRPLSYFEAMFDAMLGEDRDRIRLYLGEHEADLVAATTWVRVGSHAWYSYGASSTAKRDVRGSNAVQWRMITDTRDAGASVYDLRGITDALDPDDPHIGLIQFKVGTGGEAVEYLGEWDLPLSWPLYNAFQLYLRRRG